MIAREKVYVNPGSEYGSNLDFNIFKSKHISKVTCYLFWEWKKIIYYKSNKETYINVLSQVLSYEYVKNSDSEDISKVFENLKNLVFNKWSVYELSHFCKSKYHVEVIADLVWDKDPEYTKLIQKYWKNHKVIFINDISFHIENEYYDEVDLFLYKHFKGNAIVDSDLKLINEIIDEIKLRNFSVNYKLKVDNNKLIVYDRS